MECYDTHLAEQYFCSQHFSAPALNSAKADWQIYVDNVKWTSTSPNKYYKGHILTEKQFKKKLWHLLDKKAEL